MSSLLNSSELPLTQPDGSIPSSSVADANEQLQVILGCLNRIEKDLDKVIFMLHELEEMSDGDSETDCPVDPVPAGLSVFAEPSKKKAKREVPLSATTGQIPSYGYVRRSFPAANSFGMPSSSPLTRHTSMFGRGGFRQFGPTNYRFNPYFQ